MICSHDRIPTACPCCSSPATGSCTYCARWRVLKAEADARIAKAVAELHAKWWLPCPALLGAQHKVGITGYDCTCGARPPKDSVPVD